MKETLLGTLAIIMVVAMGYGGWRLERYIHYKWSYQSSVQTEIQTQIKPLQEQVNALEARVKKLENK